MVTVPIEFLQQLVDEHLPGKGVKITYSITLPRWADGRSDPFKKTIMIRPNLSRKLILFTALHEIGHFILSGDKSIAPKFTLALEDATTRNSELYSKLETANSLHDIIDTATAVPGLRYEIVVPYIRNWLDNENAADRWAFAELVRLKKKGPSPIRSRSDTP